MPQCGALGEAAGTVAAMAQTGVENAAVDPRLVRLEKLDVETRRARRQLALRLDPPELHLVASTRGGVGDTQRGLGAGGEVDGRPAVAQRLHLGADQHDAGFEALVDEVVMGRPAVSGNDLSPGRLLLGHGFVS